MADFRRQLKDKRQIEKEQDLEDRLDKAIGKDYDATLVPNYKSVQPRQTEEVFPNVLELPIQESDRVKFTGLCVELARLVEAQAALNRLRQDALHEAKKIALRNNISKVEVDGHRFRLWSI